MEYRICVSSKKLAELELKPGAMTSNTIMVFHYLKLPARSVRVSVPFSLPFSLVF